MQHPWYRSLGRVFVCGHGHLCICDCSKQTASSGVRRAKNHNLRSTLALHIPRRSGAASLPTLSNDFFSKCCNFRVDLSPQALVAFVFGNFGKEFLEELKLFSRISCVESLIPFGLSFGRKVSRQVQLTYELGCLQWNRNGAGGGLMSFSGANDTIVSANRSPSLCFLDEVTVAIPATR